MVWLFERNGKPVRVETRVDHSTGEYISTVTWDTGAFQQQRFRRREAFLAYLQALERQLAAEDFTQAGPPQLLREGWWPG